MEESVAVILYIAVPVVILASAFAYFISQRGEDVEEVSQDQSRRP